MAPPLTQAVFYFLGFVKVLQDTVASRVGRFGPTGLSDCLQNIGNNECQATEACHDLTDLLLGLGIVDHGFIDLVSKISLDKHLFGLAEVGRGDLKGTTKAESYDSVSQEDAPPETLEPVSGFVVQGHLVEAMGSNGLGMLQGDVQPHTTCLLVLGTEAIGEKQSTNGFVEVTAFGLEVI